MNPDIIGSGPLTIAESIYEGLWQGWTHEQVHYPAIRFNKY